MYRTLPEMIEGWTKNLALLFPSPLLLALWRILDLLLFFGLPALALALWPSRPIWQPGVILIIWVRTLFRFYSRAARSNFPAFSIAISILGIPLFVFLLIRSSIHHRVSKVRNLEGPHLQTRTAVTIAHRHALIIEDDRSSSNMLNLNRRTSSL